MELHWLRYFVAAAETGSVSRGAERAHVAQPSMSAQIRKLEHHLGTKLFDRVGRGVVLTEAGRALYPRARRILADVREAAEQVQEDVGAGRGLLRLGAIPTIAPYVLPPALVALRTAYPACEVTIREDLTERLAEALADHELDCALVSVPVEHHLVDVQTIAEEEMLVCVSPAHPAARSNARFQLADMRGQPTVTLEEMHCLGRQIQGFCLSRQLAPRVVCRTTQLSTIRELVALDVGISIVPEMAAAADTDGVCHYVRFAKDQPKRQLAVAWRRDRTRSLVARRFIEIVTANLAAGRHALPDRPRRAERATARRASRKAK